MVVSTVDYTFTNESISCESNETSADKGAINSNTTCIGITRIISASIDISLCGN